MIESRINPDFALAKYANAYRAWGQVAGYFDGDGSVYINTTSHDVLRFSLVWVDNCREQIGQLRHFLVSQRISAGEVLRRGDGTFTVQISSPEGVLSTARLLLPFCFKKRKELGIVISYYENTITGTKALEGFNESVRAGVRVGKIRQLRNLPKYSEAKLIIAIARGKKSAEAWRRRFSIRKDSRPSRKAGSPS